MSINQRNPENKEAGTAQVLNIRSPEHTFTVALTHDIGKTVPGTFMEVNTETILALAREEKISQEEARRNVLGIDRA